MQPNVVEAIASLVTTPGETTLDLTRHGVSSFPPWFDSLCQRGGEIKLDEIDEDLLDVLARTVDMCFHNSEDALRSILYVATSPDADSLTDETDFDGSTDVPADFSEQLDDETYDYDDTIGSLHARLAITLRDLNDATELSTFLDPDERLGRVLDNFTGSKSIGFKALQKKWNSILTVAFRRSTRDLSRALRRLRQLKLSNNTLRTLPAFLVDLPWLSDLDLSDNEDLTITEWPEAPFKRLRHLDVSGTTLTVPELSGTIFPQLRVLQIAGCIGPKELRLDLPLLAELSAAQLAGTERLAVLSTSLREIDVSASQVLNVDDVVGDKEHLVRVNLATLGLTEIPTLPGAQVEEVDLSGNDLKEPNLGALALSARRLKRLDLSECRLLAMPITISMFASLRVLDLARNQLTALPAELGDLPSLTDIYVDGNPLPDLLLAASHSGTQHLKRFLTELGSHPSTLREGKILFVGEGTVGKSSLVAALRGEPFDPHRETTHGIEIRRIAAATSPGQATPANALIAWDFGGQEVYRVTHPFFFSQEAIYAVTWRPRDGVEQSGVFYWLEAIRHRVGLQSALIVLVATHASEGRTTLLDFEEVHFRYYPAIQGHFSVDSQAGIGIPPFRNRVLELVQRLPRYGDPIPESWGELRRYLTTIKRGFLLLGEYENVAGDFGLTPDAARSCARILHTLGDILYFDESDGLPAIVVIDPEVLARAVSYVLEDGETKDAGGRLALSRLRALWESRDTELREHPDMFSILVGLMSRFDIAYPVAEPNGTPGLLVAEMLPYRRPLDLPWEPGDPPSSEQTELRVRYRFESRPSGLIPWLVVRNYRFITPHRWRTGVRFRHDLHGAECLVEEDPSRLTVDVVCRGSYALELFLSIKGDIDSVLAMRWPYLPRSSYIPCPFRWSAQCGGFFEYDYVVRALTSRRRVGECRECLGEVQLDTLVSGLGRIPSSPDVLVDRLEYVARSVTDSRQVLGEISSSLRFLRTEIAPALHDTPTLFTLRPADWQRGRAFTEQVFRRLFLLRLWCEFPESPHPCGDPYRVRIRKEWLSQMMPVVRAARAILRLVPVVKEALTVVGDDAALDDVLEALDFVDALSRDFGSLSGQAATGDSAGRRSDGESQESQQYNVRLLRELLHEVDPPPSHFAGLTRVVVPGRPAMWLCEEHVPQFSRLTPWPPSGELF